jgi:hypothetical protein
MPTDIAVTLARKREAAELERNNHSVLLGCAIVCLVVVMLTYVSPTLAGAVLLGLE